MKKLLLFLTCTFSLLPGLWSQSVAINNTGALPDASAMLDVQNTTKGLLVPRLTLVQRNAISNPATGLIIYQTDNVAGFYFNIGTPAVPNWNVISTSLSGWSTTGNSGTNPSTHFLGTADNQPLQLKLNNEFAGKFDHINRNYLLGLNAGSSITTGKAIIAIGNAALRNNTTGLDNIALGDSVLNSSNGNFNTAMGSKALYANSTGASNTSMGYHAMYSNTTGSLNTAIGLEALRLNTIGLNNTAIGYHSMYSNTSGDENTALGNYSLNNNLSSNFNVAVGVYAMDANTTGNSNTAVGYRSLNNNTTGVANSALGLRSMNSNISGDYNVAIGFYSLYFNTTGNSNVAIGRKALYSNTVRSNLVAIGDSALYNYNANAGQGFANNTAVGTKAGYSTSWGSYNSFFGYQAGYANTTGGSNTAIGFLSMNSNTTGDANTAIGNLSMSENSTGEFNTAIGHSAGRTADSNTYCTFLGYNADNSGVTSRNNSMALGYGSLITAGNQVRIGNSGVSSIGGYAGWSNISDGRFKKNIRENVPGLNFILQLKPVTYNLDVTGLNAWLHQNDALKESDASVIEKSKEDKSGIQQKESILQTGFVAQDVEAVAQKLGYQFSGVDAPKNNKDVYSLRYAEFVVPLVKAIQEQQKMIETLQQQNMELKNELAQIKKKLGLE